MVTKENKDKLKEEARHLRIEGSSYKEISKSVGIAKSTAKLWCEDILLKPEQKKRLYTKQIEVLSRGSNSSHERRKKEVERILKNAKEEIALPLSNETYRLFGAALYWAEGNKSRSFEITNSDPHFILFMVKWFEKVFNVKAKQLTAWLNFYSQQNEFELKQFWSELTGIPIDNFGKGYIKPANKGYKKNNLYFGTIKIYVPKGTDMRYKVFGWVSAVLAEIDPNIAASLKKWERLTKISRVVNI